MIHKSVIAWLYSGILLIYLMVAIGGITRLTDSGLSMVDWKPIMGTLPPMNDSEWQKAFDAYKQSPEFIELNHHFEISDFKSIFWWEFIHRSLGRVIGLVFIIPFLIFLWKKYLPKKVVKQLIIVFILGGLQGFLGWFMVRSGLDHEPRVSHYRLAIHLITAFTTISYLWWIILGITEQKASNIKPNPVLRNWLKVFISLLIIQIIYGALVAGMDAGLVHNSWPLMDGYLVHPAVYSLDHFFMNLIENKSGVQFMHRTLAIIILIIGLILFVKRKNELSFKQEKALKWLGLSVSIQFTLGITTLLYQVPLWLGVLHQLGALTVLLASLYAAFHFRKQSISQLKFVRHD